MIELKNSALLDRLLAVAESYSDSAVVAEGLMAAALEYITEPQNQAAAKKTLPNFYRALLEGNYNIHQLKNELRRRIGQRKVTCWDEIYFQTKRIIAGSQAYEADEDVLSADALLSCLMQEPNGELSQALEACVRPVTDGEKRPKELVLQAKNEVALLTQKVKEIRKELSDTVFGQENAVNAFITGYFQGELLAMTDRKRYRPRATFLFAGPPGVGKTFLAEKAASLLGLPFLRADMSEYADDEANIEFCGSDKVYKNGKAGNITSFVERNPRCVLLFDEVEKAHLSVIHLFLQMLDAGRLRDNFTDNEVSFANTIVIFTTNAGKQLYEASESEDFSTLSRKVILKALQKDVNPTTGNPFFPAAMCSRFATGNVVMFNHISAHYLRAIAKREVLRQAENVEREIGIRISVDDTVPTALLFAEGGAADARTVRSRAEAFLDDELYELFRLVATERVASGVGDLEQIDIRVELPADQPELTSLFAAEEAADVLVFSRNKLKVRTDCNLLCTHSAEEAVQLLEKQEIRLVLLDLYDGEERDYARYLNVEDVPSPARDFFWFVREKYNSMPIYLLETEQEFSSEERTSFLRLGVRDILPADRRLGEALKEICGKLHQQNSMDRLASANKIVSFETAQFLHNRGRNAEIRLFDFELGVAMDAEDSSNVLSNVSRPNLRFEQVIGAKDAKDELKFFVDYLKNPKKFLRSGVQAPKGVLLYGPPGTGKTMLAKAMAGESNVTFINAEGNEFLKKYVGEGPERVHELFRTARKYAPSILFIDEIDAIGKERRGGEGNASVEATLTSFLTEMDGFKSDPSRPVFVLAATNFEVEPGTDRSLDPALMRRFDRRVLIDLPTRKDREQYLAMKTASNPLFALSAEQFENIAVRSTGMSLAELESVLELSLRMSIRSGDGVVNDAVLEEAFETFHSGERKTWDRSTLERVARHEAGHAFLCWQSGETPTYLTVVARGSHGGYMQHGDHEGKEIFTREELLARIRTSLGGRAAELVYYGQEEGISTGASGDLLHATETAKRMVCRYGMDSALGLAVVTAQEPDEKVTAAVNRILDEQMKQAVALLRIHKEDVDRLVAALLEKNHLTGKEIEAILGENQ